jgi:hypothetical protein
MSDGSTGEQSGTLAVGESGAIDQLHELLEKQLELVHQGHLAAAESLCEQTGRLVTTIVTADMLAGPGGDDRRRSLLRIYQELSLMLTAQRQETCAALHTIRRGRRMLRVYRENAP